MENWKAIEGTFGKIEVSDLGRIRSWLRGDARILKTQEDQKGYVRVRVTIEGEKRSFKVHREVAKAFIENPQRKPQVNHKDGNKKNNSASNLEWVTNAENAHHAIENGLWGSFFESAKKENESRMRSVIGVRQTDYGTEARLFRSVSEAERYLDSRHISDVLKGKRNHVKGWGFVYAGGDAYVANGN
jgi:hypothetical protein